jgi:HK97 family phage major capsid protein
MRKFALMAAAASGVALAQAGAACGPMTANERRAGRYLRDAAGHPRALAGLKADASPADIIKAIETDLSKATDQAKEIAEKAVAEALTPAIKEKADELLLNINGLTARLDDLEQKSTRGGGDGTEKSIGERFAEDEKVKALATDAGQGKAGMEFKAIISSTVAPGAGAAGAAVAPFRLDGIQQLPDREFFIQDLIAPGRMDGGVLEYVQEKTLNNNAAEVAELGLKPQSDLELVSITKAASVIATYMKASKQILEDSAQLASLIDFRLRYFLRLRKEQQILTGDGAGANILGIIPQASDFALPAGIPAGDLSMIDTLRVAMLQCVMNDYPASGHVLNHVDWALIEMEKDANGRYIIGNPNGSNSPPRLWNLPVVATQFIPQGDFLTGAFRTAAQYFERWSTRVQVSNENEDDFIHNRVTILGEERGALAVYRPAAFVSTERN